MLTRFQDDIREKELSNLRVLNVMVAIIVTLLGFVFEFAYHDGYILILGLIVSLIFTSNYFLSYYFIFYRNHFLNITYVSIFLLHFWAVYVSFMRQFDIAFLLPVGLSIFIFSLIFDKFYKSFAFIFTITSFLLLMMWVARYWDPDYAVAVIAIYSGALVSDVILRRKNEFHHEIDKREKQYSALMENMNDGLIYVDNDLNIQFVNDKFCEITGYSKEEWMGRPLVELLGPDVTPTGQSFVEDLKKGRHARSEFPVVKRNEQIAWVQFSGVPRHNEKGDKAGSMMVLTDVSALKNVEELLKKREEGYRTFIDQSAVGIWRAEYARPIPVNLDTGSQVQLLLNTGRIAECNDFMAQMYGYQQSGELIGRKIKDFYHIENNFDEEKTFQFLSTFISNHYRISNAESKELDRNGNVRYILNNNIGIIEDGFLIRTWGVQTDITERKKTEKELVETNHELDTFFYKASHDLKGPLASIIGITNLAKLENKDAVIENYFNMIEKSVKRLDRTLMDLIELAKTRKGVSKISRINIKELVDEILLSLSHTDGFSKINFEVHIDKSIEITADKVLVLSVFQNLIHNATNYCNRQSPWVRIQVKETGDGILLGVTDNGKGIADNVKHKVFEMFFRGNPESPGSGLGLFIVKNALEKMKGKVWFESESGQGTSFYAEIPDSKEN